MADDDKREDSKSDMFSRNEDGTKTDVWIMEELLGDDDLDEGEYEHVIWPEDDNPEDVQSLSYRDKLAYLLRGNENSGHWGHESVQGQLGGSAPGKGGGQVELRPATKDDADRIAKLNIPPQYRTSNVMLSDDPKADLQATWEDKAGRTQYRYTVEHTAKAEQAKFARLNEFNTALPALREQIQSDISDTSLSEADRESALALYLIDKTGFRPGSDKETGAKTKAYGATTLKAGHVRVNGDKVSFRFPSKSGQVTSKTITDPKLAKILAERKDDGGRLFKTSDGKVRDYLHKVAGDFKPKDFRTWNGTDKAIATIAKMPVPKSEAAFKKAQREVAKVVAKHLGNTPAVALKSYIDQRVWAKWKAKAKS